MYKYAKQGFWYFPDICDGGRDRERWSWGEAGISEDGRVQEEDLTRWGQSLGLSPCPLSFKCRLSRSIDPWNIHTYNSLKSEKRIDKLRMTIFHNCLFYKVSQKKHSYKIFCRCSHGMRAVEHAIIAMCRTLCPHSPAHKILGNHSCVFSNFSNFVSSHESSGAENFIRVFFWDTL